MALDYGHPRRVGERAVITHFTARRRAGPRVGDNPELVRPAAVNSDSDTHMGANSERARTALPSHGI
jgi:hypothetical protein